MADGGRLCVWRCERGLRARWVDCATPINLAYGGVFWGAAVWSLHFSGQQPNRKVCVCDRAVNCLLSNVCVASPTKPGRLCEVVQSFAGVAVCRGTVRNKSVANDVVVVVYELRTDGRRWTIRAVKQHTDVDGKRQKSGIPLCSSGGARVMTRLFFALKTQSNSVKPCLRSDSGRGRCRVEAFVVRFLVEPCVCPEMVNPGSRQVELFNSVDQSNRVYQSRSKC